MLNLIENLIRFQINVATGSMDHAIVTVAIFDSLMAYAIIRAGSERKPFRGEMIWLVSLVVIIVWLALQLTEKADMMKLLPQIAGGV